MPIIPLPEPEPAEVASIIATPQPEATPAPIASAAPSPEPEPIPGPATNGGPAAPAPARARRPAFAALPRSTSVPDDAAIHGPRPGRPAPSPRYRMLRELALDPPAEAGSAEPDIPSLRPSTRSAPRPAMPALPGARSVGAGARAPVMSPPRVPGAPPRGSAPRRAWPR